LTGTLVPSSGEIRRGPFINLNRHGYGPRERVLFEQRFGNPEIGTIALMDPGNPNIAIMEPEDGRGALRVLVVDIKARLPAGWTAEREAALIADLRTAFTGFRHLYDQRRKAIIREHVRR
jgi:hypothetical protein